MGEVTASTKTPRKRAKKPATASLEASVSSLSSRVADLERKQKLVTEGYEFVANETRNLFGFGAIAQIFDAIYEKLNK